MGKTIKEEEKSKCFTIGGKNATKILKNKKAFILGKVAGLTVYF